MKFRIGYGGPRQHRHGHYRPGGRRNNGGMSEVERLIHLIASMQILFGSRRGGWVIPLLLIGLAFGGWYAFGQLLNPSTTLEKAHVMYDSSDTSEQIKAIAAYKKLLNKSDPLEPGRHWLRTDRDTLYRRVIQHEVLNAENETKASEWAIQAIEDGFTKLRFQNERVKTFWEKTLDSFKKDKPNRNKTQSVFDKTQSVFDKTKSVFDKTKPLIDEAKPEQDSQSSAEAVELLDGDAPMLEDHDPPLEQDIKPGKFDVLPGLDDVRLKNDSDDQQRSLAA